MKDGIYTDLGINEYHGNDTHISSTNFKKARRSLKEFHWYQTHKETEQKSFFDFGNAFELALLDHDSFDSDVAILQSEYWISEALNEKPTLTVPKNSAKYKELKGKFLIENEGKYLIEDKGKESFETIEMMLESCYKDQVIRQLIENIEYQTSIFWTDETTGLKLKTRPDISKLNKNVIVDVKTTEDGSPEAFAKSIGNYDYPFQACMQIDGCQQSNYMISVDKFFWLVVEKNPPYNATIYEFDRSDIVYFMDEYNYIKENIRKAQLENNYTGYSQRADNKFGVLTANIPLWYKMV